MAALSWSEVRQALPVGSTIPKPNGTVRVVVWLTDSRLEYEMGAGFRKCVTEAEWNAASERLARAGAFERSWYNTTFPSQGRAAPCNFTTIGGILVLLCGAAYRPVGSCVFEVKARPS